MTHPHRHDKILIVDDNPENIWPLIEELENGPGPDHYDIQFATDGEKALTIAFSDDRPDLILLDIMMPGMDGYEVCARLKAQPATRDIPVIFLSARSEEKDETRGLELGAQDYITKPFKMSVVRVRIKSVLALKTEMIRRRLLKKQLEDLNTQLERQIRQKVEELQDARETLRSYEEKYHFLFHQDPVSDEPRQHRILIVDDQPENIHILMEALEAEYEVLFATSGEKALTLAASDEPPDLILLDIMMPGMDGYDVCATLKADIETRDIPVIFITARGEEGDETRGFRLGAVDFIAKPFSLPIVEARVKAALRLKEAMDNRTVLTRRLEGLNRNLEDRVRKKASELEKAHESLKTSERKYRAIFQNAIEGIYRSTPGGRLLSASPSLARILGYDSPEELTASVKDLSRQIYADPKDRENFRRILDEEGEITDFETRFRKKSGEIIWVVISSKVIRENKRSRKTYQGFVVDITEKKRTRELEIANTRLRELDALKSAMMSTASHDMRSPLTGIIGFTSLIREIFRRAFQPLCVEIPGLETSYEKIINHLNTIQREGERLVRLVNDFLDLSKFESGCTEWNDCPIRIDSIIDHAVAATRGQFLDKTDIELNIVRDRDLPAVFCDPDRIMQVMVNLLGNAAKFTKTGEIRVEAIRVPDGPIEIRVADTGPGIPEEDKERIFDKFHQLGQGAPFEGRPKGTGLGLAISRQIVEHYGGTLWVESDPGVGSTFIFRLPVDDRPTTGEP